MTIEAEHSAAREGAAFLDMGFLGKIAFEGPDVQDVLQGLFTCDVKSLKPGQSAAGCLLTPKGKILADFSLLRDGDRFLALAVPGVMENMLSILPKYLAISDTAMTDQTSRFCAYFLFGPKSAALVDVLAAEGKSLPYPAIRPLGTLIVDNAGRRGELAERISKAGLAAMGLDAWETLRIEAGIPLGGRDYGSGESYPAEAGLNGAVSYEKGCYLGQETTARLKSHGRPRKQLAGLRLSAPAEPGEAVLEGAETVGRITSVAASSRLKAPVALAVLPADISGPLAVGPHPAQIVQLPI